MEQWDEGRCKMGWGEKCVGWPRAGRRGVAGPPPPLSFHSFHSIVHLFPFHLFWVLGFDISALIEVDDALVMNYHAIV